MMKRAGMPAHTSLSGICLVTMLPAPTTELRPTEQLGIKRVYAPTKQFSKSSMLPTLSIHLSPVHAAYRCDARSHRG